MRTKNNQIIKSIFLFVTFTLSGYSFVLICVFYNFLFCFSFFNGYWFVSVRDFKKDIKLHPKTKKINYKKQKNKSKRRLFGFIFRL
jgi:hypothetical protein